MRFRVLVFGFGFRLSACLPCFTVMGSGFGLLGLVFLICVLFDFGSGVSGIALTIDILLQP